MPRWVVLLVAVALGCSRDPSKVPTRPVAVMADAESPADATVAAVAPAPPPAPAPAPPAPACKVTVTTSAWATRGQPPAGQASIFARLGDQLVEVGPGVNGSVVAHEFDLTTQTWRAVRLKQAPVSLVGQDELAATDRAVVYAPGNALDSRPGVGGVFDPSTRAWRKPAKRLPLRGWTAYYQITSGGRWLLYTGTLDKAGSQIVHRFLFDPMTLEVIELPAPPFDDPREDAVVALDDDNLVVWGGYQRDKPHHAARLFDDGAVFHIKDRRWAPIPKGPSARSEPVFDLHDGKLMIFGGVDALRCVAQSCYKSCARCESIPATDMNDLVTGAYVLDLATLRWQPLAYDWTHWVHHSARVSRDGKWIGSDVATCWKCSPQLTLGSGSFFAGGLLYDANAQTIVRVAPVASPASWTDMPDARDLDDGHVLLTVERSADALVLDLKTRAWCGITLPAEIVKLVDGNVASRIDTLSHAGSLYIWRGAEHLESDFDGRITDTPAAGLVMRFVWP